MTADFELPDVTTVSEDPQQRDLSQQFVTFILNGEQFAVEMAPVQEIIRVPLTVRVPLAPTALFGLANLRGKVLPIISLRRVFQFMELNHDDSTRALVIDLGQPLGFVVDKVASVISVEPSQIESVDGIRSSIDSNLLSGVLRIAGQKNMIMVLNFKQLIADEFREISELSQDPLLQKAVHSVSQAEDVAADEDSSDERQLVSFSVASQEYAVDIIDVQEIVQIPDDVAQIPKVQGHVLGIMTLRERLLPLVSLRQMFRLPEKPMDDRSRVVVVAVQGNAIGVVTDAVSEVLRVPHNLIDPMPALLTQESDLSEISQICRLNQGKRLVSVIDVESLFKVSSIKQALEEVQEMQQQEQSDCDDIDTNEEDEEQVVVFHLANGEFGVPIESVQEIVRIPEELTAVPKAPAFIEGIINLRGLVLPVIDQRKRLGLDSIARHDRQRIMVFVLGGVRTGFIVDAVTEVLKIPKKLIEPAPRLSAEQARLLGRVANLEQQKRMIQLIEPDHLMDNDEQQKLGALLTV
ncbi:chemotaxis protein CheW [Rheinheimera sediminis]|uniref:chemotaxis protein CheW n=1 Tax=Rheinheimera sp. YQF-1 TaxID=2499626 RepID=UPI000FDC5A89|nr:chemotaxis protein CheW [Rheinheimera sp. YQF-1]RVT47391.1 chemotaxis protein CheW [Rheinheimera sp. YQF-1]